MITNIAIASVFVKDIDASKAFYTDVLGFEENSDVTLGDGYRWCTVSHPSQPELQVHLTVPGPPHTPDMIAAMNRALDEGNMHGLGMAVDDCHKTYEELRPRGSSSCRSPPTGPTASRRSAATTPATGWCWSSRRRTPARTSRTARAAPCPSSGSMWA